jgi:hypothetical protein
LYVSRTLILTVDKSVAKPAQHSPHEMRAEAGLEPDDARRKLLEVALRGQALDLFLSNATMGKVSLPISMLIDFCSWHIASCSGVAMTAWPWKRTRKADVVFVTEPEYPRVHTGVVQTSSRTIGTMAKGDVLQTTGNFG